jgi:hypothetical protein
LAGIADLTVMVKLTITVPVWGLVAASESESKGSMGPTQLGRFYESPCHGDEFLVRSRHDLLQLGKRLGAYSTSETLPS